MNAAIKRCTRGLVAVGTGLALSGCAVLDLFKGDGLAEYDEGVTRVDALISAFNARDLDAMLSMVTPDVQWLQVRGGQIVIDANGRDALRRALAAYFEECGDCTAELAWTRASAERVVTREVVRWSTPLDEKQQSSVAVYEFSGEQIHRVYYFPPE